MINRAVDYGHLLVLFVVLWAFPLGAGTLVVASAVCLSWFMQYQGRIELARRLKAVLLGSDGGWSTVSGEGEIVAARLLPGAFVTTGLVILNLKPRGQSALRIVLTSDNTPPDPLRRLRVRLRIPLSG